MILSVDISFTFNYFARNPGIPHQACRDFVDQAA